MKTRPSSGGRPRRYPRTRTRRPVAVYRAGDPGRVAFGSLETVGRGGALLRCDEPIPTATDAEVAICLAGGVIRVRARVLYQLPHEDGPAIGVEFLDLDDDSVDLLDHLVSWRRNAAWREHPPRCERWPFLLFGPPAPPGEPPTG